MSENQRLLPTQKKLVFDCIEEFDLDPEDFTWDSVTSFGSRYEVSILYHNPTDFYFKFDWGQQGAYAIASRRCEYAPGPGSRTYTHLSESNSWDIHFRHLQYWLENLRREIGTPDPWAAIARQRQVIQAASAGGNDFNTPFSDDEQLKVVGLLTEMREYVVTKYAPVPEQLEGLDKRLDYLKGAAKRANRMDWLCIAIATILAFREDIGNSEVVQDLLQWLAEHIDTTTETIKLLIG